jgi:hypothetical protein
MWALMAFVFGTVDGRNDISPKEGKSVLLPHATLAPLVEPLFDGFLCASIGDDRNGTGLIVPCALAPAQCRSVATRHEPCTNAPGSGCSAIEHADVVTAGHYRLQ